MNPVLHPVREAIIQRVQLRTPNAERLAVFYEQMLGLKARSQGARVSLQTSAGQGLLLLEEDAQAQPAARGAPGLFHIAFRLPTESAYRALVARILQGPALYHGSSDHGVSWASYFSDPDGNGIEITWDRDPELWSWKGDQVQMSSRPLDLGADSPPDEAWPPSLEIGHVHLAVASLEEAALYTEALGLRVTQQDYPGAVFMARGDYHHHLALNVWGTRRGLSREHASIGLQEIELRAVGDQAETWVDPMGIRFQLQPVEQKEAQ